MLPGKLLERLPEQEPENRSLDNFLDNYLESNENTTTVNTRENAQPLAVPASWEPPAPGVMLEPPKDKKLSKRTLISIVILAVLIPLCIWLGLQMGDRRYYFISLLIIGLSMLPFFMRFEGRKPQARELIVLSVLSAIAVAGRAAFFMLPQFKPMAAITIISGVCFGPEAGFLVGAMSGFVSNFFFGQGPWTPWQMFAYGIIGFLAGLLFVKGRLKMRRWPLCVYGFIATFFIYGILMDTASILMSQKAFTWQIALSFYIAGSPFNLIHAIATVFFLLIFSKPMIEKLERIKLKYGLLEEKVRN